MIKRWSHCKMMIFIYEVARRIQQKKIKAKVETAKKKKKAAILTDHMVKSANVMNQNWKKIKTLTII